MIVGLGIAAGVLLLGLIFVFLLYLEARNNVIRVENEKEEALERYADTIREKDSEIQGLMTEKDEINANITIMKNDYEERLKSAYVGQQAMVGKTIVDDEVLRQKEDALIERDSKIKEYQQLTVELIKDIHELEDKYIENGGALSDIYEDYSEYYE